MKLKTFTAFLLGAVFFTTCGSSKEVIFNYKWFHVQPAAVWDFPNGKLLGFQTSDDMELRECKPKRKNDKGELIQECVVVFYKELNSVIKDYKETKQKLIDCQKGKK